MTYTVAQFMDILPVEKVEWDAIRFDEFDAQGSGHDLISELAAPKWMANLVMRSATNAEARQVAALARKRFGSQLAFMIYDPSNPYPAADPKGAIIQAGTFNVQVASIGSDNQSMGLKGLPANYPITIGDKGQISFGGGLYNFFFEFSETRSANGSGNLAVTQIYPHIPPGIAVNAVVNLIKPACKMTFAPNTGFAPGQSSGNRTGGMRISAIERI